MRVPTAAPENFTEFDRLLHAWEGRLTLGLSPTALLLAYVDWLVHIASSPGKQAELIEKAQRDATRLALHAGRLWRPNEPPCVEPSAQDHRFDGPDWQRWPYNLIYQSFLVMEDWWRAATTGVHGVSRHHENVVSFATRQLLDVLAPTNYPVTNKEVLDATIKESGLNLVRGAENLIEDWQRAASGRMPAGAEEFVVGKTVAITPGKVIFRNRLIELIQYSPTTAQVYAEPILIVPAWIMKYYILDLSPHNSMVKYLVDHGHTVFMISWKNPVAEDRDLGMDDYRSLGVMAALDVISAVIPGPRIHTVGYCLGGTLLSIAAATMARERDERLQSVSLFATQTDFTDAGELMLFIDESQVTYLEDIMWNQGYLDTTQMAGAFDLLRSNDLIWSRLVHDYLLGQRETLSDLLAWNADGTRLPYRMHSEYLRTLFLHNDLFEGRYRVDGQEIALRDIRVPIFAVSTIADHVAPWRSVYKLMLAVDTDVTFVLTSGGHNAGIVSEPGHPKRSYQVSARRADDRYVDPDVWLATTPAREGSWWESWQPWLVERSSGLVKPPRMGGPGYCFAPLTDAPGEYVLQP